MLYYGVFLQSVVQVMNAVSVRLKTDPSAAQLDALATGFGSSMLVCVVRFWRIATSGVFSFSSVFIDETKTKLAETPVSHHPQRLFFTKNQCVGSFSDRNYLEEDAMRVYYEKDADLSIIAKRKVVVVGYGSQGHAHANNLRDSGLAVTVALREGSGSWSKAVAAGLPVQPVAEAVRGADLVMLLAPDEHQPSVYATAIEPNLKEGAAIAFAHGFNIHFQLIEPRADLDVLMVAPKGPGHTVRSTYVAGGGVPSLIAIARDASGQAKELALAYAAAIGAGRAGVIETSFREETETDLFGEQTVLCGGAAALVTAGFETLVEAGYAPEMAYFECLHELKLIVDFFYEGGVSNMWYTVSNTAEYGGLTRGPRIVTEDTKAEMKRILGEIQSGAFAREFVTENQAGAPTIKALRRLSQGHRIEEVGAKLRAMMPWIEANKLVDRSKN